MRIALEPAYILHQRHYRETSLLIELFTAEHGRISVVARGVRTPLSKKRALLQSFVPLFASWQGKSELMTLSSVEANSRPLSLQKSSLLSGFYLNELLIRLLPKHDPHPLLYDFYHQTLLELDRLCHETLSEENRSKHLERILRFFELKLLNELGYGLQLKYDVSHKKLISPESLYRYIPEQGFQLITDEPMTPVIFTGKSLLALADGCLDDETSLSDAKRLIRLVLTPLLGAKPLFSRKLFL